MVDTTVITDPYIWVYNDVVPPEKCQEIIDKFDNDNRHYQGTTTGGVDLEVKNSIDLNVSLFNDWKEIDKYLSDLISHLLVEYCNYLNSYVKLENFNGHLPITLSPDLAFDNFSDTGYQIQKTEPAKVMSGTTIM